MAYPQKASPIHSLPAERHVFLNIPKIENQNIITAIPGGKQNWLKMSAAQMNLQQLSHLVESTLQCGLWQYMSDYLVENSKYQIETVAHWGLTGLASGSTSLIRGIVNSMKDSGYLSVE